jgi:hypothetical protein
MRMSAEKPVRWKWSFGVRIWNKYFQNTNFWFKKLNIYKYFWQTIIIIIIIIITILTPLSRALLEKMAGSQLVSKFPAFYGTRVFITAVTKARHLSLSWARSVQSTPAIQFAEDPFYIILPSAPGSSKWSLSLRYPHQNPLYTFPPLLPRSTCPAHLILVYLITCMTFGEQHRSLSCS